MNQNNHLILVSLTVWGILSAGLVAYIGAVSQPRSEQAAHAPESPPTQAAAPDQGQPNTPIQSAIHWNKYDEGLKLAKSKNKPIYIQFHANWCGFCRKMETEVFPQQSVKDQIHQDFIPIRIVEKSTDKITFEGQEVTEGELLGVFQVTGFPTHVFMEPDGTVIGKIPGFVDADQLKKALNIVKTGEYKKDKKAS